MFATSLEKAEPPDRRSTTAAGWGPEKAVLTLLLDQHPRRLTVQELAEETRGRLEDQAVRRAVDNLSAASFVVREGAALAPAPAVVSFDKAPGATHF